MKAPGFIVVMLMTVPAFAESAMLMIPKETMTNCALSTRNDDVFKDCCFKHAFTDSDTKREPTITDSSSSSGSDNNTHADGTNNGSQGTYTVKGGGSGPSETYNKNDANSARPLFSYTWTYNKKQCSQVGHLNQYDWCICNNGGSFHDNHCWCPMGAWQKNGQCICQPGTIKYEFETGPSNSQKTFECRNDNYVNPYTFSDTTDYTYADRNRYHDPDFVDWSDPLEVFWYNYDKSGEEVGMTFLEAFDMQQGRNKSGTGHKKIRIWKAFGVRATNGSKEVVLDVVGDSKCITPDANLDSDEGTECVCSIKSVSIGNIQEKWVFNPWAGFSFVLGTTSKEGVCKTSCAGKCAEAFSNDKYNVRYSLMKHWES